SSGGLKYSPSNADNMSWQNIAPRDAMQRPATLSTEIGSHSESHPRGHEPHAAYRVAAQHATDRGRAGEHRDRAPGPNRVRRPGGGRGGHADVQRATRTRAVPAQRGLRGVAAG